MSNSRNKKILRQVVASNTSGRLGSNSTIKVNAPDNSKLLNNLRIIVLIWILKVLINLLY